MKGLRSPDASRPFFASVYFPGLRERNRRSRERLLPVTLDPEASVVRVSVRLDKESETLLRELCAQNGWNTSRCIRQALKALNAQERAAEGSPAPRKRLSPPDAIGPLLPRYMAWADGDPRTKANRLFLEALAASWACKKLFPCTPGVIEGCEGMLQLCDHFGIK
jgi:hypothetical protein